MLNLRRGLVPACLTLGAALLALPLLAAPPSQPSAAASGAQTIVLQHVIPGDLVRTMHWDLPSNLPAGVSQVVSVPVQNALLVTATPAGLAQVRQLVKAVDVEPCQVQVKFALAYASDAELKAAGFGPDHYAVGAPAARFLQTLTEQKAVSASTALATANNVNAGISISYGPKTPLTFGATPRVNLDHSLTLVLDAAVPGGTIKHETYTIQDGNTLAIAKPPANPNGAEKSMVLFVTATVK